MPWISALPLGILTVALATIISAYHFTFRDGLLDGVQLVTPPISMLMFAGHGRTAGQVGFPLVAALFCCCAPPLFRRLQSVADARSERLLTLKVSSAIAFAALAVVGAVPLQPDILEVMSGRRRLGADSILHQSAAAIFFLAAIIHMAVWLLMAWRAPVGTRLHWRTALFSFGVKFTCLALCFVPLPVAFALHPASPVRSTLSLRDADRGGLQQYSLVACVATFFASYALELRRLEGVGAPKRE